MMPQIAFGFPSSDRTLPFQNDRKDGALQSKQKKRYPMDKTSAAVDELPAAKVDAGDNAVDCEDKQAILSAKPLRLSGQHADRLLQIRVTGEKRTNGRIQAKDRKADRKHIQLLKFTE